MLPPFFTPRKTERPLLPTLLFIFGGLLNFYIFLRLKSDQVVLCDLQIEQWKKTKSIEERTFHTPLYSFAGGLGNKLFELLSLIGIARTLDRTAIINMRNYDHSSIFVGDIVTGFPNISQEVQFKLLEKDGFHEVENNYTGCCVFNDPTKFKNETAVHLRLKGAYFQSFKYFDHMREQVRKWLSPGALTREYVELHIPVDMRNDYKICVHIRRGDFETDGVHEASSPVFTRSAADYLVAKYRKKYRKVSLMVLSNDAFFSNAIFEDKVKRASFTPIEYKRALNITYPAFSPNYTAFLVTGNEPYEDLVFSGIHCDVVLITAPSSAFGWWLGYLAKPNSTVYYRNIDETGDSVKKEMRQEDFFLPEWIRLETGDNGEIVEN